MQNQSAGFWLRFAACILDGILLSFLQCLILWAGTVPLSMMHAFADDVRLEGLAEGFSMVYSLLWIAFVVLAFWPYFACFESSKWQATPGKAAFGLLVSDEQGNRISFARATARTFGKLLSALLLCFGFVMAAFTGKKQALHDLMSACLVLRKPAQPAGPVVSA
jgi:uncharacterized RDD family membrane protein YckC